MAETRCYLVIDAAANRTPAQWATFVSGLKAKPMCAALITAARGSTHNTVHINRYSVPDGNGDSRYMLGDFEMREDDRAALLLVMEDQRVALGIPGGLSTRETFRRVLEGEANQISPVLTVLIIGFGQRETAKDQGRAYIAANNATWNATQ